MDHHLPSCSSVPSVIPPSGRLLGVDFGTRRVGLSVSTFDQTIASPLSIYTRCHEQQDARYFIKLIEEYQIRAVILGLPIHMNGNEGQKAREARQYGQWLGRISQLPVDFWDERFTSAVAEDFMIEVDLTREQRKKRVDMVAAQILLQSYLDHRLKSRETSLPSA